MKIALLSDLHGFLPKLYTLNLDYIFIAGDICPDYIVPQQGYWLQSQFNEWIDLQKVPVLYIPGNHDFYFETKPFTRATGLKNGRHTLPNGMVVRCLCHTICPGWAFDKSDPEIADLLLTDTEGCDILLTHNPPHGIGDKVEDGYSHVGSQAIREYVEKWKPKLHVFGHIHEGYGSYKNADTLFINCAFKDVNYKPRMKYPVIDTDDLSITLHTCSTF